jgi:hypothetical protein
MPNLNRVWLTLAFACLISGGTFIYSAGATTYTSSSAFNAATASDSFTVENYSSGTNGQTIPNGGSFDGLTYSVNGTGLFGTLNGSIITNQFNSFSGLSLGGNQSGGDQFFFGGDSVTVTFPTPVKAIGVFFNVNANSGNYDLITPVGDVSTSSATFDTSTFVFDGITSVTPFSSITLVSESTSLGSYNVPEIEFAVATTPLPGTLPLFVGGLGMMGFILGRKKRKTAGSVAA